MSRGNRREFLLQGEDNKKLFMDTFNEACTRSGWIVHAYVLMDNHFHLLLETPEPNLSHGMRWLQGTYGMRYNRLHGLVGHVWQGRFKSPLISDEEDEHFLCVSRYIHLNPARAGLLNKQTPKLRAYQWSSFPFIAGRELLRPVWLDAKTTLRVYELPEDDAASRRKYAQRMELCARECMRGELDEELDEDRRQLMRGWYIGEKSFRDRMLDQLERSVAGKKADSLRGPTYREGMEAKARRIKRKAASQWGMSDTQLKALRKTDPRKQALVYVLRGSTSVSYDWLIKELDMGSISSVSLAMRTARLNKGEIKRYVKELNKLQYYED